MFMNKMYSYDIIVGLQAKIWVFILGLAFFGLGLDGTQSTFRCMSFSLIKSVNERKQVT